MDDDVHSCIIDIPKLRIYKIKTGKEEKQEVKKKSKRISERLLRKPSDISLKKYSLPGDKPLRLSTLKREDLLLSYRQYSKRQESNRHKHRLAIRIYDKYKITNTNLRSRLHVHHPAHDIHAITDIDDDFFQNLDGRLFQIPLYKSLRHISDKQLRVRGEVGYRKDCSLNIVTNNRNELKIYQCSVSRLMDQAKYFEAFISEDYLKSKALLEKWDALKMKIDIKRTELQNLASEEFTIRSRLIGLDYMYGLQQKYGRFLYYLSPPSWRAKNRNFAQSVEIEAKGFDFGSSNEADTFDMIFEKLQKLCYNGYVNPVLYFIRPTDLMDVLESIEKQELHHFSHVERLSPYATAFKENIKNLKVLIAQDSAVLANTINRFEALIKFCDERGNELKFRFFKILNGMFYNSVGALDVLKFRMHLEFCFERLYMESTATMDITSIAKGLEHLYLDYMRRIDAIQSTTVRKAVTQCLENERQTFRMAKVASKELRFFERLERELLRACAPLPRKQLSLINVTKRSFLKKKVGYQQSINENKLKDNVRRDLTDGEKEYLALFTDWTENEDPARYLQSLSIDDGNLTKG